MMTATRIASVTEATTLERVIRDATKSYTFDCEKRWGNSLVFFQVEMNVKWGKPMYIFTCRDVWRLGGWCDKVSGCYWPEMTVKAVFANFTATSADICLLLLRSPSLPRLRHPQRQFEETKILNTKTIPKAQETKGFDSSD